MREGQRRGTKREGSANSPLHRAIISSSFMTCSFIGANADGIFVSYTPNALHYAGVNGYSLHLVATDNGVSDAVRRDATSVGLR